MLRGTLTLPPLSSAHQQHNHHPSSHNHSSSAPQLNNSSSTVAEFESSQQQQQHQQPHQGSVVGVVDNERDDPSSTLKTLELTVTCLWLITPILASVSLINVIVAVATNSWLETEEKMRNPYYNGSVINDQVYLSKWTHSGLWKLCYTNPGAVSYDCTNIDHFSKEEYSPDPNDSTLAIPYAVTRSTVFFMAATVLLCSGYCCCLIGHFVRHRRLFTFISGIIFIVSGLVMLFGFIMYISIFKAEVGGKLRPRSQLAPALFTYRYGYSFILYVSGFLTTELAGTSAIFLFIYSYQNEWYRQYLKRHQHRHHHRKHPDFYHISVLYPCRRHPQAYINTTSTIANYPLPPPPVPLSSFRRYSPPIVNQRRYFFNKEIRKEDVHLSSSDISEVPPYPPPPPATISYPYLPGHRTFSRDTLLGDATSVGGNNIMLDDFSTSSVQSEFVTFDLDNSMHLDRKVGRSNTGAILTLSPTLLRLNQSTDRTAIIRSEFSIDTLRRTTPV